MSAQKLLLLLDRLRQRRVEHGGKHAPKAVLRMPVIKAAFAGFDRGKTAEDKYLRIAAEKRRNAVLFDSGGSLNSAHGS